MDIFYFYGASYFLIVNYTSRFPDVRKLTSTTAWQVAGQMMLVVSEYGWPETIISNNGPCYSAEAFTKLMKYYSVNHTTSSMHYPQSNELAGKYIQIMKNVFYKSTGRGNRLVHKLDDLQEYPTVKPFTIPMQIFNH